MFPQVASCSHFQQSSIRMQCYYPLKSICLYSDYTFFWATTIPGRLVSFTEAILQSKAAKVAGSGITYFYCILVEGDQYAPTTAFSHTHSHSHASPVHLNYSVGFSICYHWQRRFNNHLCLLLGQSFPHLITVPPLPPNRSAVSFQTYEVIKRLSALPGY